jgi:IS30 family transposase
MCGVTLKAEKTETVFLLYFLSERRKEACKMDGYSYLTFDQRRKIEALYSDGERAVDIAAKIGRSVAAIYEELKRGYTGELDENERPVYSADLAQQTAQENIRRRGNRRAANQ